MDKEEKVDWDAYIEDSAEERVIVKSPDSEMMERDSLEFNDDFDSIEHPGSTLEVESSVEDLNP